MPRKPIGETAMTDAERPARYRVPRNPSFEIATRRYRRRAIQELPVADPAKNQTASAGSSLCRSAATFFPSQKHSEKRFLNLAVLKSKMVPPAS
jgi:hypothetical protein